MNTRQRRSLAELFEEKRRENPAAPAVFDEERALTRQELSDLADTIAAALPPEGGRIGIVMDHSVEMIAAILAVLKKGAAYVPAEPSFPRERLRFMMRDAAVAAVIVNGEYRELFDGLPKITVDRGMAAEDAEGAPAADGEGLAYILYTSGTTGKPKGVMVTEENVRHYVRAFRREFRPGEGDVMLQHSVCTFDIFVEEVFPTLLAGAVLAIPPAEIREDAAALASYIDRRGVTIVSGFPYLLQELNGLPSLPRSLRLLISGGDVLRGAYVTNLVGQVDVYNTYGPSETTVCASYYHCSAGEPLADGTYPVGRPVYGAEILLLDEAGHETREGETGEICILGGGVALGYTRAGEKEKEAFQTLADGRRMYRSGDLGYRLPDGSIAFLRRKDTQIMIGGKRVEVSEVENALMASGLVNRVHVSPETDEEELRYMVAYIVREREETTAAEIRSYLGDYLPDYMIPECIAFLDEMPLTPNGKVDRDALPKVSREAAA
ncbi:MAG: amino acid adenylation domain-containing protein [Bacillota bacterium]|jgi:D-alanine--poly(phosphoribitol) ligase subunit 1